MVKNSFTLFETLISIFLLSIVIVGFSQNSYYDNFDEQFQLLNEIENSFTTKSYTENFSSTYENILVIKNDTDAEDLLVKKIEYKDEKINLIKYEIN